MHSMSNDPKSYRVPVLRLSDVIAGDDLDATPSVTPAEDLQTSPSTPIAPLNVAVPLTGEAPPVLVIPPLQSSETIIKKPIVTSTPSVAVTPPAETPPITTPAPLQASTPNPTLDTFTPPAPTNEPDSSSFVVPASKTNASTLITEPTPVFDSAPLSKTHTQTTLKVSQNIDTNSPKPAELPSAPNQELPTIKTGSAMKDIPLLYTQERDEVVRTLSTSTEATEPEVTISELIDSLKQPHTEKQTIVDTSTQVPTSPTPTQAIGFDVPDIWETTSQEQQTSSQTPSDDETLYNNTPEIFTRPSSPSKPLVSSTEQPVAMKKAAVTGTNLTSLRERILQQSVSTTTPEKNHIDDATTLESADDLVPNTPPTSTHAYAIAEAAESLRTGGTGIRTHATEPVALDAILGDIDVQKVFATTPPANSSAHAPSAPEALAPLQSIRTLRSDVARMVTHNKTSVLDMLPGEQQKQGSATVRLATQARLTTSSYLLIGASVALILGAIIVGTMYFFSRTVENDTLAKNFFFVEEAQTYEITNKTRGVLLSELTSIRENSILEPGKIKEIRLTETLHLPATAIDETSPATTRSFLTHLEAGIPATLSRSLADQLMLGVHQSNGNQTYLIFAVNHYENAFSGMIEWESTMSKDLAPLFETNITEATVSATTTGAALSKNTSQEQHITFEDRAIANMPMRILTNSEGVVKLVWSMPDTATVVITTSPETLENIYSRMTAREY
jgi:hypothetical protein